ncbi:hypothetical protein C8R45DRAFT_1155895 [Mycena sanguinolenta]|nr:hypothetical protein C8R45DRAFT_1155895 [Mycena sanguinolenta]
MTARILRQAIWGIWPRRALTGTYSMWWKQRDDASHQFWRIGMTRYRRPAFAEEFTKFTELTKFMGNSVNFPIQWHWVTSPRLARVPATHTMQVQVSDMTPKTLAVRKTYVWFPTGGLGESCEKCGRVFSFLDIAESGLKVHTKDLMAELTQIFFAWTATSGHLNHWITVAGVYNHPCCKDMTAGLRKREQVESANSGSPLITG